MKNLFILSALMLITSTSASFAQVVTSEFIVAGKCDMCQTRIINATDLKGVKGAYWSPETRILKVTYKADKISLQEINQAINKVGHDTQYSLCSDEDYNNLHHCCMYERLTPDSLKDFPEDKK